VAQAHHADTPGLITQLVVGCPQGRRIDHLGTDGAGTGVADGGNAGRSDRWHKKGLPRLPVQIQAQRLLLVEQGGRRQGHAPQLVLHVGEVAVEETHQASQLAAPQTGFRQRCRRPGLDKGQRDARGVP
ncbi:hypothetical protein RZS08_33435, partial [Arthrospira platensis SPKY1]|nr:hypothetical protein [Arthrospira platensis SPKY1]